MSNKLIEFCAESTGLKEPAVESVLEAFKAFVARECRLGNEIRIEKFGSFDTKIMPAHTGRNPRTGESVEVPQKVRPKFKFVKSFVDSLQFEVVPETAETSAAIEKQAKQAPATQPVQPAQPVYQTQPTNAMLLNTNAGSMWHVALDTGAVYLPEGLLLSHGATPDTLVWRSGMQQWEFARNVKELAHLFGLNPPTPPVPTPPVLPNRSPMPMPPSY